MDNIPMDKYVRLYIRM